MSRKIIVEAAEPVTCPSCKHSFSLEDGISRQAVERHANDFERTLAARRDELRDELAAEAKRHAERATARQVEELNRQLAEAARALTETRAQVDKVREDARKVERERLETDLRSMSESLVAKDEALDSLRSGEVELRRQLREAEDAKRSIDVEYQRKLDEARKQIAAQERAAAGEDADRRVAQMKAQLEQAQKEAADLKRKLEQGSQQVQGEALELGLETLLRASFPMDEIEEVPKGFAGADLLQKVRSPSGQVCGVIIWESKDTKAWQAGWLPKLKDDQRRAGAEIAALVTTAMPKDVAEPFVRVEDVWVMRMSAVRPVAEALRFTLLEMHKLRVANEGRSEKMELLYSYICSPQFAHRMKAIVEGFATMQADLEAEKRSTLRLWAKREKQLSRLTGGMVAIVGDLQGIGHETLPKLGSIAPLAAPEDADEAAEISSRSAAAPTGSLPNQL